MIISELTSAKQPN